uniref:Uncharacterized protein n=1 Tax=Cacopsylla melanoneura TaxID=428564 RepID=A0A8D8WET4_9HEMI
MCKMPLKNPILAGNFAIWGAMFSTIDCSVMYIVRVQVTLARAVQSRVVPQQGAAVCPVSPPPRPGPSTTLFYRSPLWVASSARTGASSIGCAHSRTPRSTSSDTPRRTNSNCVH